VKKTIKTLINKIWRFNSPASTSSMFAFDNECVGVKSPLQNIIANRELRIANCFKWGIVCCLFWLKTGESVFAQSSNIIPDSTLDAESSTVLPLDAAGLPIDAINGGSVRGINLFHSFQEFNVREGRSAYFFSPSIEIENILARVTGKNRSEILGTLGTLQLINGNISRSNANLFLINPNGIVFGEKASLDLAGSFVATTANAVEFGDGGLFSASQPEVSKLLTINPSAFLLNQIPAPIINQSQVANNINASLTDGLRVDGKSLLLLGGNIDLDGGTLRTFGGRLEVVALAGTGKVGLRIDGNNLDFTVPSNIPKADILMTDQAIITNISILGDGGIQVVGNNLKISDNSSIESISINQNSQPISIEASQVNLSDFSSIIATTLGSGNSANIIINTDNLNMQNSGVNTINSAAEGNAGNIFIRANNSINLDNVSVLGTLSLGVGNDKNQGSGGDVFIDTKILNIQNLSGISINSFLGKGKPGNLVIKATDSINLVNNSFISTSSFSAASGGNINIETGNLHLRGGSQINNSSIDPKNLVSSSNIGIIQKSLNSTNPELTENIIALLQDLVNTIEPGDNNFGQANSGNIDIRATKSIVLSGVSPNGQTVNTISTESQGAGKAGNLTLSTEKLIVQDGSTISSQTTNTGDGGNLSINVNTVDLANNSQIIAESEGTGKAGNINLNASGKLNATNSSINTSSTQSSGGNINVTAQDIRLFGDSDIRTNVFTGTGGGGNITLTANSIIALNDSDILSFALDGKGGDIRFNTLAFLSSPLYRPTPIARDIANIQTLDGNQQVDVNASGAISGDISGTTDVSFLQNSLIELPQNSIDTNALLANSCIVRSRQQQNSTFFITGKGGLPERPGDAGISAFSTGKIQSIPNENSASPSSNSRWKIGESIIEPQGVYRLPNGQRILSRECS
jgi:filamentous hemagglutinin family protein